MGGDGMRGVNVPTLPHLLSEVATFQIIKIYVQKEAQLLHELDLFGFHDEIPYRLRCVLVDNACWFH